MSRGFLALGATLLASACGRGPEPAGVTVERAVVTLPAVPGGEGAAYFTLKTGGAPSRLVGVSSPAFQRAELHGTMTMDHGAMTGMTPLGPEDARFSADAPLVFAGGGKHAMLFGVDPALRPGTKVTLMFQVEPGATVTAEAEVRGPGQVDAH